MLIANNCLAKAATTIAYSYIGPEVTYPIYHQGTIGRAKAHLEHTAKSLDRKLQAINGHAYISVNKALVTQASSAIPVVPLYIAILYQVMKTKKLHEGCIEQIWRLFSQFLYAGVPVETRGFIRLDDREMSSEVQAIVADTWTKINSANVKQLADLDGYQHDFYRLFGFAIKGVNYATDINIVEDSLSILS